MTGPDTAGEASALAAAWKLQRSGNFVSAFDCAQEGLQRCPDSLPLQHLSILALASCGSTHAALAAYRTTSLSATADEDYLALEARLLKDLAFQSTGGGREDLLIQAASAYERIAGRTGGTFTTQNAALLWTLAGASDRAARLARSVVDTLARSGVPSEEQGAYFHWATMAEAALVLDDRGTLTEAVTRANPVSRRNLWARTRTYAQLRRLAPLRADCAEIVARWFRPSVAFVLADGHRLPSSTAQTLECDDDLPALAFATDLGREAEWEALTRRGIQTHVIVAGIPSEAVETSPGQLTSNRSASGQRGSVTWSSLLLDDGDDNERTCTDTAFGLSVGHADALHAPWVVIGREDGVWRRHRNPDRASLGRAGAPWRGTAAARGSYGVLFADAVGYSSLNAADTRRYWTKLLPDAAAAVLRRHAGELLFRKTWGDAVHGVFSSATAAARAALEMTEATARLADELAFGRRLAFRVAVHFGAADHGVDPVEEAASYFGPQLSFAARIVPVAPPGSVFATEALAAQLSLEGASDLVCTYVGTTSLAKDYGRVRLLALSPRR
jgi:adenylate cyclase